MSARRGLIALCVVSAIACPSNVVNGQNLFWNKSNTGAVRADLDGGNVTTLFPITGLTPSAVARDSAGNAWYFAASGGIYTLSDECPTNPERIYYNNQLGGLAFHTGERMLYFVAANPGILGRIDPAGGAPVTLATFNPTPMGISIDEVNGKLYWTTFNGGVHRANLDGSDVETLAPLTNGGGIAVDPAHGYVYWTDRAEHTLLRADLDGTGAEVVSTSLHTNYSNIAIDPVNSFLYWFSNIDWHTTMVRADLSDPSQQSATIVDRGSGPGIPYLYAIPDSGNVIWGADRGEMTIDGAPPAEWNPFATGIEVAAVYDGWGYWSTYDPYGISYVGRFRADGSRPAETLVTGFVAWGLSVHPSESKFYFIGWDGPDTGLYRSGLDGNDVELMRELLPAGAGVRLAVDPVLGIALYMNPPNNHNIYRVPLDGSGGATSIGQVSSLEDLAVDAVAGQVYVARHASSNNGILRIPESGSSQDLVYEESASSVAVGPWGRKVYWKFDANGQLRGATIGDAPATIVDNVGNIDDLCSEPYDVPGPPVSETLSLAKNRYASFVLPPQPVQQVAIEVTLVDVDGFPASNGEVRWLAQPQAYAPDTDELVHTAQIQCDPQLFTWTQPGIVYAYGAALVPNSRYEFRVLTASCLAEGGGACASVPTAVSTIRWGKYSDDCSASASVTFSDIFMLVKAYQGEGGLTAKFRAQLQPNVPDPTRSVSFADIAAGIAAFKGHPYPYGGPNACP